MKKLLICVSILTVVINIGQAQLATSPRFPDHFTLPEQLSLRHTDLDSAELDSFILATMDTYHVPGLSACILQGDDIPWTKSYGLANIATNQPVADTTLFCLASVSKPFISTAVMQLVERGLIDLDVDVNSYLPFPVSTPVYPDSVFTMRMLLAHLSGIDDNWDVLGALITYGYDSPIALYDFLYEYLTPGGNYYNIALNFMTWAPGYGYEYSNVGACLAALAVEHVTGLGFEEYCQQFIFEPLDMYETAFFLSDLNIDNIAMPYYYQMGYGAYGHTGVPYYPSTLLRTSAPQLARFFGVLLNYGEFDGVRILDSTSVAEIRTPQYSLGTTSVGLCLFYYNLYGRMVWWHDGWWLGVGTCASFCPNENTGAIVLTNMDPTACLQIVSDALYDYASQSLAVIENENPTPGEFTLHPCYPNPFNSSTVISYTLRTANSVQLSLYDIAGRQVADLVDGWRDGGQHQVVFEAADLPSGIYFARLTSGDASQVEKILLIK